MEESNLSQQERKKIQNRIAQRNYRKRLKSRSEELEVLKKQLASGTVPHLPATPQPSQLPAYGQASIPTVGMQPATLSAAPHSGSILDMGMSPLAPPQSQARPDDLLFSNALPHQVDLQQLPLQLGQGNGDTDDNQWWLGPDPLDKLSAQPDGVLTDSTSATRQNSRSQELNGTRWPSRSSPSNASKSRDSISAPTSEAPSTGPAISKPQVPKCPGKKMMPILLAIQTAGYDSVDSMVQEYYTAKFPDDSAPHWAQKSSRAHRLRNLLTDLYEQSTVWSDNERKGLLDAAVTIAESLCQQQLLDFDSNNEMIDASS